MAGSSAPPSARDDRATLRFLALPMMGLLVVEFLLGMSLDLFLPLPGGSLLGVLLASPVLLAHVVVGVLLIGVTGRAAVLGVRLRATPPAAAGVLGLLSAFVAFLAGLAFVGDGSSAASFVMSAGFAGVLVAATLLRVPAVVPEGGRVLPAVSGADAEATGGRS